MVLTNDKLKEIISESLKRTLNELSARDIDDDSYFGGGLPDKYFDENNHIDNRHECDGYVVEDGKTGEVISIFRNRKNAIKECDKNHRWQFWGFNFKD